MPDAMPQEQAAAPESQGGNASEALQQIQTGFESLSKIVEGSQGLDDNDKQLFQKALMATDAFVQAVTAPAGGEGDGPIPVQAPKAPGQPMPANASKSSQPMPAGSH